MHSYTLYLEVEDYSYEDEVNFKLIDEKYKILEDGSLVVNPQRGLNWEFDPTPKSLTRKERYQLNDFEYCNNDEIEQIQSLGSFNFCNSHNDRELELAIAEKKKNTSLIETLPGSPTISNTILSLNKIIGFFIGWYRDRDLDISKYLYQLEESNIDPKAERNIEPGRSIWSQGFKKFAEFVVETYWKDNQNIKPEYNSLKDASNKLFIRYEFIEDWDKDRCYNYVRNIKRIIWQSLCDNNVKNM